MTLKTSKSRKRENKKFMRKIERNLDRDKDKGGKLRTRRESVIEMAIKRNRNRDRERERERQRQRGPTWDKERRIEARRGPKNKISHII